MPESAVCVSGYSVLNRGCLITGTAFAPVSINGKIVRPGQANNVRPRSLNGSFHSTFHRVSMASSTFHRVSVASSTFQDVPPSLILWSAV